MNGLWMQLGMVIKSAIKYVKLHPGETDCRAALERQGPLGVGAAARRRQSG
jgi:hypothetical protein